MKKRIALVVAVFGLVGAFTFFPMGDPIFFSSSGCLLGFCAVLFVAVAVKVKAYVNGSSL